MHRIFLLVCPDQPGIIARFSELLFTAGANIVNLEQHVEDRAWFFMRVDAEFKSQSSVKQVLATLTVLEKQLRGTLQIFEPEAKQNIVILATAEAACPRELFIQEQAGTLSGSIAAMIANKPTLKPLAGAYHKPFHEVSAEDGMAIAEQKMSELVQKYEPSLVVLARYMKVLSGDFVAKFPNQMINIHHGFLPAFRGNRPYHQAWERGVKCIGATAHFVTAELDGGPIIAQEVMTVTHQHSVDDMIRAGGDIEKRVLYQAVEAFLSHKIILHQNRTIIFH